jgi:hypothetical protein
MFPIGFVCGNVINDSVPELSRTVFYFPPDKRRKQTSVKLKIISLVLRRFFSKSPSPLSGAFHSLEYVLLFQAKEQGLNRILRAGLSVVVAGRAIAAIFAGETVTNAKIPVVGNKKASVFLRLKRQAIPGFVTA